MKLIDLKKDFLMDLYDNDLTEYLKVGMPTDCFKEYEVTELLDFNAMCEDIA
jgi:hypothetical protein